MTDQLRQAAQQALECIERLNAHGWILADFEDEVYAAITALRTALEQQAAPVQERITRIAWDERGVRTVNGIPDDAPQRSWQGLTDEEATKIWDSTDDKDSWELLKRVEAKLKEKNDH